MKKLLGILVPGLLICSTVFAGEIKPLNKSGFIFNDGKRVKYIKDYKITDPDNTILVIFNHGLTGKKEKQCNWPSNVRQISKLSGQKINGKEIKVFMNCEHTRIGGKWCWKKQFMPLEEFVGDKALCENAVYFNRKHIGFFKGPENLFELGEVRVIRVRVIRFPLYIIIQQYHYI